MTTPTVDASARVSQIIDPARAEINQLLQQVTGNPEAVLDAGAAYRAGNGVATNAAQTINAVPDGLTWTGTARTAFDSAHAKLGTRVARLTSFLHDHEDAMQTTAPALYRARASIQKLQEQLDAAEKELMARSRAVQAAQVPDVERVARDTATKFVSAAHAVKNQLAKALAQLADRLDRKAAAEADAKEKARCPYSKKYDSSLKNLIRDREGKREYIYGDPLKIATTGYGTNLRQANVRPVLAKVLRDHPGGDFTSADVASDTALKDLISSELNKPIASRKKLTEAQMDALLEHYVDEKKTAITKAGVKNFDSLPASVQAALISAAYNSMTPFKEATKHINAGDYESAAKVFQAFGASRVAKFGVKKARGLGERYDEVATILRNKC